MTHTDDDIGLVLLHGAGLGAFIWNDAVSRMRQPALAVDFPNRGQGDRANRNLALRDYAEAVVEQVERWGRGRVALVAHSIGGCVALEVADRLGDRVVGLVGVGAAFPRSGETYASCLPFPQKLVMPLLLRAFGTRPPAKAIERGLCSDLTPEQTREVVERFTPESRSLYTDDVEYRSLPAARWYVKLTEDREFPSSMQHAMAGNLEATRVVEMDSGHLPMMSRPADVARIVGDMVDHIAGRHPGP